MIKKNLKVLTILMVTGVFTAFLFTSCGQSLYDVQATGSAAGKSLSAGKPQSIQNWTEIPVYSETGGGGGHSVYGKASNGNHVFLAAHWDDGTLGYGIDGLAWEFVEPSDTTFGTSFIKYLAFLNNTFWAVGQDGKIATSPNGLDWTAQTQTITTGILYAIAWNQSTSSPIYIAVSDDSKIIKKVGSASWTDITPSTPSIKFSIQGIAYGSGTWVIVCDNGYVSYSTDDGATWADLFLVYEPDRQQYNTNSWKMVAYGTVSGTGYFVATTRYGVGRSTDGANWDWDEVFPSSTGFSIWLNCVLYDGSRFLVSGGNGAMAYYDGTWHADWQDVGGGVGYWTNKIFGSAFVNGVAYDPEYDEYIATGGDATPIGVFTTWSLKKELR